jgi:hypothetical protein
MQSCAGSVLLGSSAPHLDGNIWRSPAFGGGGAQGPDCFFYFCSRVFFLHILRSFLQILGFSVRVM